MILVTDNSVIDTSTSIPIIGVDCQPSKNNQILYFDLFVYFTNADIQRHTLLEVPYTNLNKFCIDELKPEIVEILSDHKSTNNKFTIYQFTHKRFNKLIEEYKCESKL